MKIYLIRHGQTSANIKKIIPGAHAKLTKVGSKQAYAAARKLKNLPVDVVITSPYERAKKTAAIIAKQLKKRLVVSNLLKEKKLPTEIEGKPSKSNNTEKILDLLDKKNKKSPTWHYSDEENFEDAKRRGLRFIKTIKKLKTDNVVVVSHKYFIKLLLFLIAKKMKNYRSFARFYKSTAASHGSVLACELVR
jgi:broad specificity phosphatase PhoE